MNREASIPTVHLPATILYDNGQHELAAILKEAFAIYASRTQFVKDVSPERYKLFQVADLACTLHGSTRCQPREDRTRPRLIRTLNPFSREWLKATWHSRIRLEGLSSQVPPHRLTAVSQGTCPRRLSHCLVSHHDAKRGELPEEGPFLRRCQRGGMRR